MSSKESSSSLGILEILTLIFIVLKLVHVIDWSWIWILSPLWIEFLLIILLGFTTAIMKIRGKKND